PAGAAAPRAAPPGVAGPFLPRDRRRDATLAGRSRDAALPRAPLAGRRAHRRAVRAPEARPAAALRRSAVASLVAPGAHACVDAGSRNEEEDQRVESRAPDDEEPSEVGDEQGDRAVEDPLLPRLPQPDLAPAEVAPEEVRDEGDREEEREAQEDARGRERRLEVQHHHEQRDRRDDQHPPDEGRDPHAVMYARTASAAATSVAPANQARRVLGSAGA